MLGIVLGSTLPQGIKALNSSLYKRYKLEKLMGLYLGDNSFDNLLTDELMVVAYDYNAQEPRFFSKYFDFEDPGVYNVPVGNATGASSAAPLYFEPKRQINGYGLEELQIDGGVICNNPSMYAYQMARLLHN
jgi:patatin-like phospholipase/acyl hydrolase